MKERTYIAIDLKSFYASVECKERGLDPLDTNLVVADESRTDKTICLAVSPSLKSFGIPGRPRLYEAKQKIEKVNRERKKYALSNLLAGKSYSYKELQRNPDTAVGFIVAPPRMAFYIDYSTRIYQVYLKYIAPEDIIVYSIDEVFMDVTSYLNTYKLSAHELAMKIVLDVLNTTGITATAGIGTNLFLCKVAMDIVAKHIPADENGVRIAELDEMTYRKTLWSHTPITDFWRVGKGYAKRLEKLGCHTMGDVARLSLKDEDLLYQVFGVNAELLIDHAWGHEPCTIKDVKAYKPESNSLGSGQVLKEPYEAGKARLVLWEMADNLSLELVDKGLLTNQIVITVGYDIENLTDEKRRKKYHGKITTDNYNRKIPKHAHGTFHLERYTSSSNLITDGALKLFDRIINKDLLIRRLNITACNLQSESAQFANKAEFEQLDLFSNYEKIEKERKQKEKDLDKEKHIQEAMLKIKKKYGKNAILKGANLEEGATAKERNAQIGGHKA